MEDRRKHERKSLADHLNIYCGNAEQPIGRLVNITPDGFMMRSRRLFEAQHTFHFNINLPGFFFRRKHITFTAVSIWCRREDDFETFYTGFQLRVIEPKDLQLIQNLVERILRVT